MLPAVALPEWFGAVRTLIGIVGALLGVAGGLWVAAAISHVLADAVRWAAISLAAGTPAPPGRFFGRRREHRAPGWPPRTSASCCCVFALIGWGPGVGIASLAHGLP